MTDIHHETIQLTHRYSASAKRVYAAYLNPRAREIWSAPNETSAVEIVSADIRSGGVEETRCGTKGDLEYRTEVRYHSVLANELITFSEALFHGESLLMVALITFEFRSVNERVTELVLTDQITSFVGRDGVEGHRVGFSAALANLQEIVET